MKKLSALFVSVSSLVLCAAPSESGMAAESYPGLDIVSIQDAPMTMSGSLFRSIRPRAGLRPADSYRASLNVFLIRYPGTGKLALIDAGFGRADSALTKRLAGLKIAGDPGHIIPAYRQFPCFIADGGRNLFQSVIKGKFRSLLHGSRHQDHSIHFCRTG